MKIIIENLPPTADSAYFRARYPQSWWWTPDHDFMASILLALQGANWQRSGGKGEKPQRIERPKDSRITVKSAADLTTRKAKLEQEKQRRAQAK